MGEGIAMGGKQGRKKRNWLPLQLAAAMPLVTLALAALAARLILGGKLPESSLTVAAGVIAGLVAFLGALIAALHSGRRKLLCGLGRQAAMRCFCCWGTCCSSAYITGKHCRSCCRWPVRAARALLGAGAGKSAAMHKSKTDKCRRTCKYAKTQYVVNMQIMNTTSGGICR